MTIDESKSKSSGRISYTYNSFKISEEQSKYEQVQNFKPVPVVENEYKTIVSDKSSSLGKNIKEGSSGS